ncbi:MAG: hypothetical protein K2P92_00010 [Bdellovibrionaceae bacterium]|nr:hypothetical protein [Pseudobdellovibrionaceae bacterium]
MKKIVLTVLLTSLTFAAQVHAQEETQLAADVAIKCTIFPYDTNRTRIPEQPLGEITVKKDEMASLETKKVSLGSLEGLPQVNFEIFKDGPRYNPAGTISISFMEIDTTKDSSMILAGGALNNLGGSMLLYRSAHSRNIYIAQCQKQ